MRLMPEYEPGDTLTPDDLASLQLHGAREFLRRIREGGGVRFPWVTLDTLIGPMLPGWLVVIGGRPKGGKTTFLLNHALSLSSAGRRFVYVGTETSAEVLRIKAAAMLAGLPVDDAIAGKLDPAGTAKHDAAMADLASGGDEGSARLAIFASTTRTTIGEVAFWCEYAVAAQAPVLFFDYFQRLDSAPGEDRWASLADGVRQLKNLGQQYQLTLIVGAQLKAGDGILGAHLPPGDGAWFGTSGVQMEADVAIQLWRAFLPGTRKETRQAVINGDTPLVDILKQNIMTGRIAKHRWRDWANDEQFELSIKRDLITDIPHEGDRWGIHALDPEAGVEPTPPPASPPQPGLW